ncbi:M48 family metallopeptidase [Tamlana fucoidanivorans]|uniref:M48 family metallopeptidase n=1 Tax=Allotamlana fucoidanivorans TaxID=2583814 RepID=A0A5C4SF26_9FLAO|nr:M48 family metallopeptidase [Tamlana fucoidanivorans]TNJ42179.1 M48 family metallopeptidase [Tamlana fucoidanivorans]
MKIKHLFIGLGIAAFVFSCSTNPFTGKKTMALVPNSQLFPTSFTQYNQFLTENKVITGTSDAKMIKRVGERIASASEKWLSANGYHGYLKDYKWEYNLVDDETVNAWCMPGGKIVFYTGILPIAKSEAGVAAIMGHEVAHALANHGQQRMSAGMLQQLGAVAGNIALQDESARNAFNQYYGVGSQVGVMLPFSRNHETEADKIGLYLMAIAGYNPNEAAELWKRMKANAGSGQAPPEILSTHPSNDSRIANLTALAPTAIAEAKKFGVTEFRD